MSSVPRITNWSLTVSLGGRGNLWKLTQSSGPVELPAEKAWCGQGEMRTDGELQVARITCMVLCPSALAAEVCQAFVSSLCTRTRQDRTARHPRLRPLRLVRSLQRSSQAGDHTTASHTNLPDRLIACKQPSRTAETSPSLQPPEKPAPEDSRSAKLSVDLLSRHLALVS
jgi:hypothetical protein